jgi:hypothetical protein
MHYPQLAAASLLSLGSFIHSAHAATCSDNAPCILTIGLGGANRDQMNAARAAVCGSDLFKTSGVFDIEGTSAGLEWTGGGTQQTCFDAFQNNIDQCSLGKSGLHTHLGRFDFGSQTYFARDCRGFR